MKGQLKNDLEEFVGLRAKLSEYGSVLDFTEGDVILTDQQYVKGVPIVMSGNVRVTRKDGEGHEILLYYIKSGESCVMSFLGAQHQEKVQINAIAEDEVQILFIPNDKVLQLQREDSQWLEYIFKLYHKRFEELLAVVNSVAFKKMDQRILEFLKEKRKMTGSNVIRITHSIMAEELGTARTVVSRLLKQLENQGQLTLGRNNITLL